MFATGATLHEARSRRGLALADVQAETNIPERFLRALEEDRLDLVPGDGRRLLREYSEFLGLPVEQHVGRPAQGFPEPEPEYHIPPPPRRRTRPTPPVLAAALVVLALAGAGVWHFAGSSGNNPGAAQATPVKHAAKRHKAPAPAPPPRPTALTLVATRGDCWLSVQAGSATGRVLYERILLQGQKLRFGLRKPLWIRFGAPANIDVTVGTRSANASLPTGTEPVVATAKGLRPPAT
jgi:cytoskeleton protein RodZ